MQCMCRASARLAKMLLPIIMVVSAVASVATKSGDTRKVGMAWALFAAMLTETEDDLCRISTIVFHPAPKRFPIVAIT